eukprot:4645_1
MSIDFTEFSFVSCRGYRSCSSSNFINSSIDCDGEQSCASSAFPDIVGVECTGYRSCESTDIITHHLRCEGAKSCFNSTITLMSGTAFLVRGAFALSHSIIQVFGSSSSIYLSGFQAAFGSQISCILPCTVHCYANACQGLYVEGPVTITNHSANAILAITNLSHFNPDEFNQTIFDILGYDDESCGSGDGDLLVNSYNGSHTPQDVIMSGNDTMRICV